MGKVWKKISVKWNMSTVDYNGEIGTCEPQKNDEKELNNSAFKVWGK